MGFQSSFNQLLATASAAALGAKHIQGQKEARIQAEKAQVQADWNVASSVIDQGAQIRNEYANLKNDIETAENSKGIAEKNLEAANTKALDYRMAHMDMNTGQSTMTRGQKAYSKRLENQANAEFTAFQSYEQEVARLQARKQGLQERLNMLGGRVQSMSEDVHAKLPKNWQQTFKLENGGKK